MVGLQEINSIHGYLPRSSRWKRAGLTPAPLGFPVVSAPLVPTMTSFKYRGKSNRYKITVRYASGVLHDCLNCSVHLALASPKRQMSRDKKSAVRFRIGACIYEHR
jgi:hypothetical protein